MLVSGPAPISTVQSNDRLDFRPFQRVTAGIVQVTPTQAILSVDGVPIVARLSSTEQAALLSEQRTAQFLVTKSSDQEVILKWIRPDQNAAQPAGAAQRDLVGRLIAELNLPMDGEHILIVRALLNAKAAVTPAAVKELAGVLSQLGDWDANDAGLAAAIKAAGLPLSALSLRLAAQTGRPVSADFSELAQKITQALARRDLPADFRFVLETMDRLLADMTIDPTQPRAEIARALATQVGLIGKSFENILKQQAGQNSPLWPENSLVIVARFHQLASSLGFHDLADAARQLMDDVHFAQLINCGRPGDPALESWLTIPLSLRLPEDRPEFKDFSARLKIAKYPDEEKDGAIDPENTRLGFQLDFADGRAIQLQLVVRSSQVRTDIHVTDEDLQEIARGELDGLRKGIEELGFKFVDGQVKVSTEALLDEAIKPINPGGVYQSIFLEI